MTERPRVRVRLNDLIAAAQAQWGALPTRRRLTVLQVRKGVQAHQATIEEYLIDGTTKFRFDLLARLCWFFGCPIDSLLAVERAPGDLPPVVIGRATMPEQLPAAGSDAIRVLNFLPGQVALHTQRVRAETTWHREAVLALAAGGQTAVARQTLETLLAVLGLDRVSQLVAVQCDLAAVDPQATTLGDAIRLLEPRPVWLANWADTVQQWRGVAEQRPAPGTVTPTDIAAIRFLHQRFHTTLTGDSLAAGLGIRRTLLQAIAEQTIAPEIGPADLPAPVRQYLDAVAPQDWIVQATAVAEQDYQALRSQNA